MSTKSINFPHRPPRPATTLIHLFIFLMIPGLMHGDDTMPSDMTTLIMFDDPAEADSWRIINDGVMGGLSRSTMKIDSEGHAVFSGLLSLRNNGGFASVRRTPREYDLNGYEGVTARVKGDGRTYQFRIWTSDRFDGVSYMATFQTEPESWITISIPFASFRPTFRGRTVSDAPPLDAVSIQQLGFLIADKLEEAFELNIDWIGAYKSADE